MLGFTRRRSASKPPQPHDPIMTARRHVPTPTTFVSSPIPPMAP